MTPSDVEAMVRNLDHRVDRIEQILPTLATKEDLKAFATKKDLEAFATKKDLEAFATKKDLEAFATKKDLEAFATKEELRALRTDMREGFDEARRFTLVLHEDLKAQIGLIAEHLADVMSRLPPRQ
jgi:hypothetical protein